MNQLDAALAIKTALVEHIDDGPEAATGYALALLKESLCELAADRGDIDPEFCDRVIGNAIDALSTQRHIMDLQLRIRELEPGVAP